MPRGFGKSKLLIWYSVHIYHFLKASKAYMLARYVAYISLQMVESVFQCRQVHLVYFKEITQSTGVLEFPKIIISDTSKQFFWNHPRHFV